MDFIRKLLDSSQFMPHGHCYLWQPNILWLNVISDGLIALAYFAIPLALIYLVRRRKDLAFNWIFVMFAMFIVACGMTHVMGIWTVWNPQYGADGLVKAFTAVVSLATAAVLWPLMPKALAMPSQTQLKAINEELKKEIAERKLADERIRSILDTAYEAFVAMDVNGVITEWNRQAEATFGWTRLEAVGRAVADTLIPVQHRDAHWNGLKHFLATGEGPFLNRRLELSALHRDGHELPVETTISSVRVGESFAFGAFFRDITERKRAERFEAVRMEAARILGESDSLTEGVARILESISRSLEWDLGRLWIIDAKTNELKVENTWSVPLPEIQAFAEESRQIALSRGEGLPGQVWETGNAISVADTVTESRFSMATAAAKAGLQSGVALPIKSGTEIMGVIELLSRGHHVHEQKMFDVMAAVGSRIGLFIQRRRAEIELRQLYQQLERRVEERTKELAEVNKSLVAEVARHKRTQEDLRRQETQLRLITDALPVMISYLDANQHYQFINGAYEQWYGKSMDQIIGRHLHDVINGMMYERVRPQLDRVLAGETVSFEDKLPYKDRERYVSITLIPDLYEDGSVRGFVSLISDISHHKSIECQLKTAKDAAEAANRAKTSFLANMSHEIRTPLGAVLGFSELMANPDLSDSERANYVSAIKRNGELLSSIINDILDLSKVEAGKLVVEQQEVSLSEVLTDITTLLNLQAVEKGIKLTISSEGAVPSVIRTDPLRLRQILINIVGNAIKFTQKGSVDVRLKQVPDVHGRIKLAIDVTDTGPGISREQAAKLFEPFTQADVSSKRKHGGTGLGLVLAKRLADLLGGDVVLTESTPGKGSTFTITIDPGKVQKVLFASFDAEGRKQKPQVAIAHTDIRLDDLKVLVVEDSADNRLLIGRILKLVGANVETANNGREALDKLHKGSYDVLLMDLQMPVMDGYEAIAELRKEGVKTPVIALTAHALKEERDRCIAAGFNDHLSKPIDRNALVEQLARYTHVVPTTLH